jgi:hypothetical protein
MDVTGWCSLLFCSISTKRHLLRLPVPRQNGRVVSPHIERVRGLLSMCTSCVRCGLPLTRMLAEMGARIEVLRTFR